MKILERMSFEPRGGLFRELEGLKTNFETKDPSLYRKLLPKPFAMPSRPVVMIYVVDFIRVRWPLTMARYQEWSVLLKSVWKREEGWHAVTMPITSWIAMLAGRLIGFPKYVTDEITLARRGETRVATAKYKSVVQLALEFHLGTTRRLASWEKELAENEEFFQMPAHQLVPPGRGPRVLKVIGRHVTQPKWTLEHGMIRVRVDPSESWAGLVPDEGEFPGTYHHLIGGSNLIVERPT